MCRVSHSWQWQPWEGENKCLRVAAVSLPLWLLDLWNNKPQNQIFLQSPMLEKLDSSANQRGLCHPGKESTWLWQFVSQPYRTDYDGAMIGETRPHQDCLIMSAFFFYLNPHLMLEHSKMDLQLTGPSLYFFLFLFQVWPFWINFLFLFLSSIHF